MNSENILEEKIAKIAASKPIELDTQALPFSIDQNNFKATRINIFNWLRTSQGLPMRNNDTGRLLLLSNRGIRELISYINKDDVYTKSLAIVPQIIENMLYLETVPNTKNKRYQNYSYFATPIKMDGKDFTVLSAVGINKNGEYYYHQKVFEGISENVIKKARGLYDNGGPAPEAGAGIQASNS